MSSQKGARRPASISSLNQVLDGVSVIAQHESAAIGEHYRGLRERLSVARRARSVGELVQNQVDLWPATRHRLRQQGELRRRLWKGLVNDLRCGR
jgi:hypothetical protein